MKKILLIGTILITGCSDRISRKIYPTEGCQICIYHYNFGNNTFEDSCKKYSVGDNIKPTKK